MPRNPKTCDLNSALLASLVALLGRFDIKSIKHFNVLQIHNCSCLLLRYLIVEVATQCYLAAPFVQSPQSVNVHANEFYECAIT